MLRDEVKQVQGHIDGPVDGTVGRKSASYLVREIWRALWIVIHAMAREYKFDLAKKLRELEDGESQPRDSQLG